MVTDIALDSVVNAEVRDPQFVDNDKRGSN